jgi:hypothetical protein
MDDGRRRAELGRAFADVLREATNMTTRVATLVAGHLTSSAEKGEVVNRRMRLCFDYDASLEANLPVLRGDEAPDRWRYPAPLAAVLDAYAEEWPALSGYFFSALPRPRSTLSASIWGPGLRRHAAAMRCVSQELDTLGVPASKYVGYGYRRRQPLIQEVARLSAQILRGEVDARVAARNARGEAIRRWKQLAT